MRKRCWYRGSSPYVKMFLDGCWSSVIGSRIDGRLEERWDMDESVLCGDRGVGVKCGVGVGIG